MNQTITEIGPTQREIQSLIIECDTAKTAERMRTRNIDVRSADMQGAIIEISGCSVTVRAKIGCTLAQTIGTKNLDNLERAMTSFLGIKHVGIERGTC